VNTVTVKTDPPPRFIVRAVGGPTAILEIGGLRLLTDPTFDAPGEYVSGSGSILAKTAGPAFSESEVGPIDLVLLSHNQHVDNLDTAGRAFLARVPLIVTTASAAERLGGESRALGHWEHVDVPCPGGGTLRITGVPAQHGPDETAHLMGEVTGFLLSGTHLPVVYVSGDNASLDVVRAIAARVGHVDVAILFAGGAQTPTIPGAYLTLTSRQAAEAARILGAPYVVPLHFNSWKHFTEGADSLNTAFAEAGLIDRLALLEPSLTWSCR